MDSYIPRIMRVVYGNLSPLDAPETDGDRPPDQQASQTPVPVTLAVTGVPYNDPNEVIRMGMKGMKGNESAIDRWARRRRQVDVRQWIWYVLIWLGTVAGGVWVGYRAGSTRDGLYVGLALVGGCLLYATVFLTIHLMLTVRAETGIWPEAEQRISRLLKPLCEKAGVLLPRVFIIPETAVNACAAGVFRRRQYVGVTQGALRLLSDEELSAVLAHEVTHLKRRDALFDGWWIALTGVIIWVSTVSVVAGITIIASDSARPKRKNEGSDAGLGFVLVLGGIVFGIVSWFIVQVVLHAVMRRSEYMADNGAVLLTGKAKPLMTALQKMEAQGNPLLQHSALSMMFSVNPLPRQHWWDRLFATHPRTSKRLMRLEQLGRELGEV